MSNLLPSQRSAPSPQTSSVYHQLCGVSDGDTLNNNDHDKNENGATNLVIDLNQVVTPKVSMVPRAYVWPLELRSHPKKDQEDEVEIHKEEELRDEDENDYKENKNEVCNHNVPKEVMSTWMMPTIDLEKLCSSTNGEESAKLVWACKEWGGFYLVGHGVVEEVVTSASQAAHQLFSLPLQTKLRALRQENTYEGYGKAVVGRFFKSLMWSEGFTMKGHPSLSIHHITSKLCTNPDIHNPFRDAFEQYDKVIWDLSSRLLTIILEGLGVKIDEFKVKQFDPKKDCQGALQLNYYPPCPDPKMTLGLAPHTDSTCLTIMHQQQDVIGLQICRHGKWIQIPPLKDSFVVHVGDMLQVLSNGNYKSIIHRAIVNEKQSRLSMAYFCAPPPNVTIYAPNEVVESSSSKRQLYKHLKWEDYLKARNECFIEALNTFKQD